MAANSFGNIFKITSFGESHGSHVGVVIDGCPAGLEINERQINQALKLRAPGNSIYTSLRDEPDRCEIVSGLFCGKTTGAPICILIANRDADSSKYEPIKDILRPGHANFTYLEKYGVFDYRGGGRASARETVARVAAGSVAMKFLEKSGIHISGYIKQIGALHAKIDLTIDNLQKITNQNPIFCPCSEAYPKMSALIERAIEIGDSVGGVVEFLVTSIPVGLGDPVYQKLEANLAYAMMSLPAARGFEIGDGFQSALMYGSEHNDIFIKNDSRVETKSNHAGGILGGITTGMPIIGRVAFKPASSIKKPQISLTTTGENILFQLPEGSRHDPCVAIRAVPVVRAMVALVLADAILLNRCAKC